MTGEEPRYRPLLTLLELTRRCNLRCLHCGSTSGHAVAGELSTAEWVRIIDDAATLGAREIVLLGGEPLLHPDWERIARHARERSLAPLLITNGMLLDAKTARRCIDAGIDRVGVSIDAADPEVHDRIRGVRGSHARAWTAVGHLRDAGVTCSVITTVSRLNRDQLDALRDRIAGRGIGWQVQTTTPNGERFPREQTLSPAEFYEVVRFVSECRARYPLDELPVAGAHDFGYHSTRLRNYAERPEWHGCEGGIATVGVRADGAVMPCLSMADRFAEGNVRNAGGLAAIWTDPNRFTRNRRFRVEQLEGGCRGCAHGATCRAGCPDVAWNATGSVFDDPYCLHRIERESPEP
jgi:radical SAM protein with 4Fe4S-binding SPASM domain